jgi:hypothetical protein
MCRSPLRRRVPLPGLVGNFVLFLYFCSFERKIFFDSCIRFNFHLNRKSYLVVAVKRYNVQIAQLIERKE